MLIGLLLYLQKINKDFIDVNLRAMLADEYILIVPFAYRLYHGATFLRNIN